MFVLVFVNSYTSLSQYNLKIVTVSIIHRQLLMAEPGVITSYLPETDSHTVNCGTQSSIPKLILS